MNYDKNNSLVNLARMLSSSPLNVLILVIIGPKVLENE